VARDCRIADGRPEVWLSVLREDSHRRDQLTGGHDAGARGAVAPYEEWRPAARGRRARSEDAGVVALPGGPRSRVGDDPGRSISSLSLPVLRRPSGLGHELPQSPLPWHRSRVASNAERKAPSGRGRRGRREEGLGSVAGPDHEWQATMQQRTTHRSACPFCADRRVSVTNCLATVNPKVAAEWHPTRNGKVGPARAIATSKDFAWWRCALGHDWRCSVRERVVKARGCPTCVSFAF
jgi:hypothetical protein